jgi:DNA segregation ATPase FtsK/SpoIIIE, S-DNA-T family
VQVLGAAAASLARQHPRDTLDVVIAPLVAEATAPAERLAEWVAGAGQRVETVRLDGFRARVEALAQEVTERLAGTASRHPVAFVLYAADAAETALDRAGTEALRKVLHFGPETGVHVLGWWRSPARLKALLMIGATPDDLGAWVALDVQGSEVQPLVPGMLVTWSPRPGRGLLFDRAQHSQPEVVIVPSLEAP